MHQYKHQKWYGLGRAKYFVWIGYVLKLSAIQNCTHLSTRNNILLFPSLIQRAVVQFLFKEYT